MLLKVEYILVKFFSCFIRLVNSRRSEVVLISMLHKVQIDRFLRLSNLCVCCTLLEQKSAILAVAFALDLLNTSFCQCWAIVFFSENCFVA